MKNKANKRSLKIQILSDVDSWKNNFLASLAAQFRKDHHQVRLAHRVGQIKKADVTFIIGFLRKVSSRVLRRSKHNIVVHESALPKGRGWSPLAWQLLEGKNRIPFTAF